MLVLLLLAQVDPVLKLSVDARESTRGVIHVREQVPVQPGRIAIYYPKWIPGQHSASGTIESVTSLHFTAAGKELTWRRDPVDMYTFWVSIPKGSSLLNISFDWLSTPGNNFAPSFARLKFTDLAMSPVGPSQKIFVQPSVTFPTGWKWSGALEEKTSSGGRVDFKTVSFRDLLDSPLLAGQYLQRIKLGEIEGAPVRYNVFADNDSLLPEATVGALKHIPAQFAALFGSKHFRHYDFLSTRSNFGGWDGLEHHESSEDGTGLQDFQDDPVGFGYLFTHEFFHSWNGKFRRPAGLATPDFLQPMKGELLWVYEGLTQYYGFVMAARCGLITKDQLGDVLAGYYLMLDTEPARKWRSVADSAVAAQLTYHTPDKWTRSIRRPDFYFEGMLVWLEADCLIRSGTKGERSLDDFCRAFATGSTSLPVVKPYSAEEVYGTLNHIYPYDWRTFFEKRLYDVTPRAPKLGIEMAGYEVAFSSDQNWFRNGWVIGSYAFARCGMSVSADGEVVDLDLKGNAYVAGLNIGDRLTQINGQPFSPEDFHSQLAKSTGVLKLLVNTSGEVRQVELKCRGGAIYPHLKRTAKPDILLKIASPRN